MTHLSGENGSTTTVEIDPAIHTQAQAILERNGYPSVEGDGWQGISERQPYDRVISTVSVGRLPPPWIQQTTDDALILEKQGWALQSRAVLGCAPIPIRGIRPTGRRQTHHGKLAHRPIAPDGGDQPGPRP